MAAKTEYPVALGGAHRADVKKPGGFFNNHHDIAAMREQQAEHLLKFYGLSFAMALVVAEHAFENGRRA